jgi:GNAT superfamily N-acetyltransferase
MSVRMVTESEIPILAKLWYDGWQDAHATILPKDLARHRTPESFRQKLASALEEVRVVGHVGEPVGLCLVKEDELNQLYVLALARGTGVAATLLADGEARIRAKGFPSAWLACAIGNERAARFYEKHKWQRQNNKVIPLDTPEGVFHLEVWYYRKDL